MSTVDARDITKPVDEDFVPQTTAELRALKVLVAAIETALQNEDLDIRADVTTLLRSKLQVPVLDLALPTLVANGALIVNGAGTGLVWDADYGEFVANAAALTGAVEDATQAAADAQEAAEAAQAAVDTGAVNKASTAEQIMNGDLTIQRDAARIRLQSDTTPANTLDLSISGGFAYLTLGGALDLNVSGDVAFISQVNFNDGIRTSGTTPSSIQGDMQIESGAVLSILDAPVAATDAANKAYVDSRLARTVLYRSIDFVPTSEYIYFNAAEINEQGYWSVGTGIVSLPTGKFIQATCSLFVQASGSFPRTVDFSLMHGIEGKVTSKRVVIADTTPFMVELSFSGIVNIGTSLGAHVSNHANLTILARDVFTQRLSNFSVLTHL